MTEDMHPTPHLMKLQLLMLLGVRSFILQHLTSNATSWVNCELLATTQHLAGTDVPSSCPLSVLGSQALRYTMA